MAKELVISSAPHETRVAIVEDGQLCEIYVEREKEFALVGSIYKGRVTRVLPGMQSAFVDIGLDSDAFLYVSDFIEDLEEYDHVANPVEGKVERMEQQGGEVFPATTHGGSAPSADASEDSAAGAAPAEPDEGTHREPPAPEMSGEESAPVAAASPAVAAPDGARSDDLPGESRAPRGSVTPPPERRDDFRSGRGGGRDRGRGGFGRDRGGRGGRGRFDRGGRGGAGGGRDFRGDRGPGRDTRGESRGGNRPGGREFPASKYASHRPYEPAGNETQETTASVEGYEPIILPGETRAKAVRRPAPAMPDSSQRPAEDNLLMARDPAAAFDELHAEAHHGEASHAEDHHQPDRQPEEDMRPAAAADAQPVAARDSWQSLPEPVRTEEPEAAAGPEASNGHDADLTEDERSALAEQLAEAEHEAAQRAAVSDSQGFDEEDGNEPGPAGGDETAASYEADETDQEIREGILAAAESGADEAQPDPDAQPTSARIESNNRARFQRPQRRDGRRDSGRRDGRPGRGGGRGRGPHPRHGGHRRPMPPRRTQLISELLKAGQEIIVQIAKEPLGKKGARITSHVALPGRYLVYMPTVNHVGVSRKIGSGDKRSRLRHLVAEAKTKYPGGFIVRTAAENATEEEIQADIDFLGGSWLQMLGSGEGRKAPALLHRDLNLVERILRDHLSNDYTAIWIDNEEEYTKVVEFVGRFQPAMVNRVKLYTKETPIFEELGIQQEIDKSLRPKVWLKSGGYIVINHTEALVAIDVNTGKFVGKGSTRLEDTIVRTNIEAVKEVVRQIRLRDLGGIIVVDFIDMEERKNRDKVMHALEDALRTDRAPSKVLPFNEFGLVAITRKRTKQALERVLCQPCPYCTGSGMVKSIPTICYEIQAEARKMALEMDGASITLRVHPEIAKSLKTRESALVEELENWTRKSVIIQGDPTLHFEQYDIH
jgi:ribonuclease G